MGQVEVAANQLDLHLWGDISELLRGLSSVFPLISPFIMQCVKQFPKIPHVDRVVMDYALVENSDPKYLFFFVPIIVTVI